MKDRLVKLMLVACLVFGTTGCSLVTKGAGNWELYAGIRTAKTSEEPASVGIESKVLEDSIEKIVDSLTDGEVSPDE